MAGDEGGNPPLIIEMKDIVTFDFRKDGFIGDLATSDTPKQVPSRHWEGAGGS